MKFDKRESINDRKDQREKQRGADNKQKNRVER